jgi:hypothetical protein
MGAETAGYWVAEKGFLMAASMVVAMASMMVGMMVGRKELLLVVLMAPPSAGLMGQMKVGRWV